MVKRKTTKKTKNTNGRKHQEKVHCIVKRRDGSCHYFDIKKVYASVYAACYVVKKKERECEKIANKVASVVKRKVHALKQVSSKTISGIVVVELKKLDKNAAFMYDTHRDIS